METNPRITALVLCGGEGTRLRKVIGDTPKCVAPINGKPFIYYIWDMFNGFVDKIVMAASDKKDKIFEKLVDYEYKTFASPPNPNIYFSKYINMELIWLEEKKPQGTLAGIITALAHIHTDLILVSNGDTYCNNFDFNALLRTHSEMQTDITIARYSEKHSGIWLVNKKVLDTMPKDITGLNKEVLLCIYGFTIGYYNMSTPFVDIGTPSGYASMVELVDTSGLSPDA